MFDPSAYALLELQRRERFYRVGCLVIATIALVLLCALFFLLSQVATFKGGESHDEADARAGIARVLDDQVKAWNAGDLDGFMDGYWRDDKLTFMSGDKVTQGWEATRERYRKRYFTPNAEGKLAERGELSFAELDVESLSPNAAVVRGRYILKLAAETSMGRFTLVFRRLPEGWKITSDHTSAAEKSVEKK